MLTKTLYASNIMIDMGGPNEPDLSTLQVKNAILKQHNGDITSIEKKATTAHPNCHIVKMTTPTGGLKYIRYACN
jgi:hypothetical protein